MPTLMIPAASARVELVFASYGVTTNLPRGCPSSMQRTASAACASLSVWLPPVSRPMPPPTSTSAAHAGHVCAERFCDLHRERAVGRSENLVAGAKFRDARADGLDLACEVGAGDPVFRPAHQAHDAGLAADEMPVEGIRRSGAHSDEHFAGVRRRLGELGEREDVRWAELRVHDSFHAADSAPAVLADFLTSAFATRVAGPRADGRPAPVGLIYRFRD
jgi:hypothetical protein